MAHIFINPLYCIRKLHLLHYFYSILQIIQLKMEGMLLHNTLITFPESFTDLCSYQFVTTHVSALFFQCLMKSTKVQTLWPTLLYLELVIICVHVLEQKSWQITCHSLHAIF